MCMFGREDLGLDCFKEKGQNLIHAYQRCTYSIPKINSKIKHTWPICSMKSFTTGRVPTPADHNTIPCGIETSSPVDLIFMLTNLSETFTTRHPVKTSIPSRWNFCSANEQILSSNLQRQVQDWSSHFMILFDKHLILKNDFIITIWKSHDSSLESIHGIVCNENWNWTVFWN